MNMDLISRYDICSSRYFGADFQMYQRLQMQKGRGHTSIVHLVHGDTSKSKHSEDTDSHHFLYIHAESRVTYYFIVSCEKNQVVES